MLRDPIEKHPEEPAWHQFNGNNDAGKAVTFRDQGDTSVQYTEAPPGKVEISQDQDGQCLEMVTQGNAGNDMGISTMGYRSSKYTPDEWANNMYMRYYQGFADRDNAERSRHEARRTQNEVVASTNKTQDQNTKKIQERLKDIGFWKQEVEREIYDIRDETDKLISQKKRLETALYATEVPLHIATDNLNARARRQGADLVQDDAEIALLKEVEVINNVQDLLRKAIAESEKQIKSNRNEKQNLEMDWSDKLEAHELDTKAGQLRNEDTNKQFYPGAAKFQEIQSTPESWAQFSHDNIARAEHERMASIQLRTLIDNLLDDTSRDMREAADVANVAVNKRIEEMEDAKQKLEEQLRKTVNDIGLQEKKIEELKKSIRDLENPLKVAQTRLHLREGRPNIELARDDPQYGLIGEVNEISQSIDALMKQLNDAENSLKDLQDDRIQQERDVSVKKNSLFIDREKVMGTRTRYPSTVRLQGYNR